MRQWPPPRAQAVRALRCHLARGRPHQRPHVMTVCFTLPLVPSPRQAPGPAADTGGRRALHPALTAHAVRADRAGPQPRPQSWQTVHRCADSPTVPVGQQGGRGREGRPSGVGGNRTGTLKGHVPQPCAGAGRGTRRCGAGRGARARAQWGGRAERAAEGPSCASARNPLRVAPDPADRATPGPAEALTLPASAGSAVGGSTPLGTQSVYGKCRVL